MYINMEAPMFIQKMESPFLIDKLQPPIFIQNTDAPFSEKEMESYDHGTYLCRR